MNNFTAINATILPAKMTKRARMTTQDVIDAIYSDDDDSDVDDPDEPFMDGSDDDFSDLDGEEDDYDGDDYMDTSSHPPPVSSPASSPLSPVGTPPTTASPSTLPAMWTTSLQPVTITPFQSAAGPTVPIPDSPLEVFELFFTAPLLQMVVDESNR